MNNNKRILTFSFFNVWNPVLRKVNSGCSFLSLDVRKISIVWQICVSSYKELVVNRLIFLVLN